MFSARPLWRAYASPLSSLFAFTGVALSFTGIGLAFALGSDLHGFITARTCFRVAALAWTIWDHVITIDDELHLIWFKPMRVGSFLFFVTRYFGLLCQLAIASLDNWISWNHEEIGSPEVERLVDEWLIRLAPLLQFFIFWIIMFMMNMRVYALYENSKKVALINGVFFVMHVGTMVLLWLLWPVKCQATGRIYTRLDSSPAFWQTFDEACAGEIPDSFLPFYWIPALMFGLLPTSQILCKLATGVSLVSILVEDSIIHVFLVGVFMFMHIVLGFYGLATYAIPFIIASQSVGGSHFILHLRSAFYGPNGDEMTSTAFATQSIGFAVSRLVEESFYTSRSPAPTRSRIICLRAGP